MGLTFFEEIGNLFDEFDRDSDIRVVIIKAEGKSFSAGTDLEERLIDELISIFMASIKTAKQNKGKPS